MIYIIIFWLQGTLVHQVASRALNVSLGHIVFVHTQEFTAMKGLRSPPIKFIIASVW